MYFYHSAKLNEDLRIRIKKKNNKASINIQMMKNCKIKIKT